MRFAAWVLAALAVAGIVRPAAAQPGPLAPTGAPPERAGVPSRSLPPDTSAGPGEQLPNILLPPVMPASDSPVEKGIPNTGNVRVAGVDRGDVAGFSEPPPHSAPGHPGEGSTRRVRVGVP
ncbi:MAG TPA: hypothetical protein VLM40_10360, partial [Gemmata sp.]|nr:hypothetical protein [Gemmata sp.]